MKICESEIEATRKASAVRLRVSHYAKDQIIKVAIAHGEGNYIADAETIACVEGEGRVAFRYCDTRGGRERRQSERLGQ